MRKAYVLIQAAMGSAEAVAGSLQDKPGVIAADVVTGPHDVIAVAQGVDAVVNGKALLQFPLILAACHFS